MALQKINWTQIDTLNIPMGEVIELGSPAGDINDGYFTDLHISGVSFFDYLQQLGYTGGTPSDIQVADNSGLDLNGKVLSTTYNTTLDPALTTLDDVGGIVAGTTVASLSGKTFVEFVDELLFPVANPTYTIPTITISGILSETREIGSTISENISVYGDKNDAGSFSQLRILRDGSPLDTHTILTQSSIANIAPQYGYSDPNNPNYRYSIPTPYSESYVIPYITYPGSIVYRGDGNYGSGVAKQNNKGVLDVRTPAIRSVNAPQAADVNFNTSTRVITAIFPYFYGSSSILPTPSFVASEIAAGHGTKVLAPANGTLSIPYNVGLPGHFIWFAYFSTYTSKTIWYVNALDSGDINGSFITTAVTYPVNSPEGYWNGINFKMHWSVYLTVQDTIEFRNS